jgi:S1-C subfamily serine protease
MAAPGQTGQQHRRRRRVGCQAVAVLVVVLLAGGCTSDGASTATSAPAPSAPAPTDGAAAAPDIAQNDAGGLEEVPRIVAEVAPSVVTVIVPGGNGSGVVYTADGLILTNEHVVRGNRAVQVAFADGQRVDGVVTAVDEVTDLALVQADRRDLPPARFATELPEVGTLAVVIGSPLGFQNTCHRRHHLRPAP